MPPVRSKFYWVALLYFSSGFPLGIFYDIFPVFFRQQGIDLKSIGLISLFGLAWTLKFLWAPAVDHFRHHRIWMAAMDVMMGLVMLVFAMGAGFGPWVWAGIGALTLFSATNDIAIDAYSIELLQTGEIGLANGLRIGFYRVGMLGAGLILVLSDYISWKGAFILATLIFMMSAILSLFAPKEKLKNGASNLSLALEIRSILSRPRFFGVILLFFLASIWLVDHAIHFSKHLAAFWSVAFTIALLVFAASLIFRKKEASFEASEGPMFGALLNLLQRPHIFPVLAFILLFKLPDSAMGFMIKPFWVDSGFSNTEIGLVSVNIGLGLSIAGGLAGGWITDRIGIFRALWILGLCQGFSNLGYVIAAWAIPHGTGALVLSHRLLMYFASGIESFTSGLGTAAFLAFLMSIVDKRRSATEYALLSSVFALSRSFAGWAGGVGAQELGYAPYFLLTLFMMFPAYLFLPWVKKMLVRMEN